MKGGIYEERSAASAAESTGGAGQYLRRSGSSRRWSMSCPEPDDTIIDPAAGTGGFLTMAYESMLRRHDKGTDRDEKRRNPWSRR
ncbi:MAG: SAM-dependent DNA methyltransferase [Phycisphaerales bacterium]|nr:SAM-dependent DNA methyltransferase [Phycisphaerales bacterium]